MARGRRRKLDVRYDEETLVAAEAAAAVSGRRVGEVVRRAAALGMAAACAELGAGSPSGSGERGAGAGAYLSGAGGIVPGATATPPGGAPRPASPRPPAAALSPATPRQKLAVVVARLWQPSGPIAPVTGQRAVSAVKQGRVRVGGVVVTNPAELVDPGEVVVA